jgi:hypothetical protein
MALKRETILEAPAERIGEKWHLTKGGLSRACMQPAVVLSLQGRATRLKFDELLEDRTNKHDH